VVSGAWINEHYEVEDPQANTPALVCRRCRKPVGYVTKHAVLRHGDRIRIEPITASKLGNIPLANAW
jgi:hypothetical protein